MKNIFDQKDSQALITRIEQLTPTTPAQWGKMNVAQMLAHCNVAYEMAYDRTKYPPQKGLKRFLLKTFVKPAVVGPKPYAKNTRTAPEFLITDARDFEAEKQRLIDYVRQTQQKGTAFFDNRESYSFGKLTATEWNTLFYKHLDHHLTQFGV